MHNMLYLGCEICCIEGQVHRAGDCFDEQNVNPWHCYALASSQPISVNSSKHTARPNA